MAEPVTEARDVVLLGFTLPDELVRPILENDPAMPVQTHTFAWSVVSALRSAGLTVELLSAAPVSNYPKLRKVRFKGTGFDSDGVRGRTLGFLNVLGAKHVTRFASCCIDGTRTLSRARPKTLLIHGVHSPFLLYGLFVGSCTRIRTVVILTDPPGVPLADDGRLVRALKALDVRLVRAALRHVDGVVALTKSLASEFAPGRPRLILEGILNRSDADPKSKRKPRIGRGIPRLLYAGGLSSAYGVDRLVEAVIALPVGTAVLETYGKGHLAAWIDVKSESQAAVQAPRYIPRETVLRAYSTADLLVQPRPCDQHIAQYSFPSKLLEYMESETPVLTTRLSGIPEGYDPFVFWIDDDSTEGIRRAIDKVLALPPSKRVEKGYQAANFVREVKSASAQGRRLRGFFETLVQEA